MKPGGPYEILVALDESVRQLQVFETAAQFARRAGATVHFIRVLLVPPEIPPGAHAVPDGLEQKLIDAAGAELRALMATAPDLAFGPPIVVVDGTPWRRIVDAGKTLDVDLIVVGNHRHHGLDRMFESVAGKVIGHADRDVLVVRVRDATGVSSDRTS